MVCNVKKVQILERNVFITCCPCGVIYVNLTFLMNEYETIDVFCDREHASLHYGRCSIL